MKKKDVIGHMTVSKEGQPHFLKRIQLLPLLVCLLIAVLIWLLVANIEQSGQEPELLPTSAVTEGEPE